MPATARPLPRLARGAWGIVRVIAWVIPWVIAWALPHGARAQTIAVAGPTSSPLPTITPAFTVRVGGAGALRPLRVVVQVAGSPDFAAPLLVDTAVVTLDTVVTVQLTRPLPSEASVYWRGRVDLPDGRGAESPVVGPRLVPPWVQLLAPNSPAGDVFDVRRPLFVWRAAPASAVAGAWRFDFEITAGGRPAVSASGLQDTTFRPPVELQASTSYRWSVRAVRPGGESVRASSAGSFSIVDPPLPTSTLLYQNFPNPFPSPSGFATCFWFDVGEPGAAVRLDIRTLQGQFVRTIIPGTDGVTRFAAGRYGRGAPGAGSSCDNRFTWDGTGADGRTVPPGVYLALFSADGRAPTVRRILFRGR